MMRKSIVALLALAAVGLAQPTVASARGGGGGGGGHGGGGGGGFTAAVVVVVFTAVAAAFTAASRPEDSTAASQAVDFVAADFMAVLPVAASTGVDFTTDFTGMYS